MLTEARAAAGIHHPAIVQIFDFGRTRDGDPYISMELLDGESLSGTLKRRERLSATKAIQVLLPIADALVVAHARGVVHRDLKPDNILLARLADGRVQPKILDFGIAKLETSASSPKLTLDGTVLGSPAYMSPEQARGQTDIDLRVDVWAFSVMLYELVTGCTPFAGESYNALLYSIVGQEPLTLAQHGIDDPELWAILARGMDKDREARFGSMRAIGRELAKYLLNRKVKTDIAQGALKAWLEPSVRPQALPSLFASLAPSGNLSDLPPTVHPAQNAGVDALLELMREPVPPTQLSQDQVRAQNPVRIQDAQATAKAARGATTVGRQRSIRTFKVPAPLARVPRWVWFAGPAALAFLGSVIASLARTDPPESAAAPVASAAAPAPKPAPVPVAAEPARVVARPSKPEPSPSEPASAPASTSHLVKAPVKPVARPYAPARTAGARKQASRTELKNPFAH
jgi:serine/threonine-protein kinase